MATTAGETHNQAFARRLSLILSCAVFGIGVWGLAAWRFVVPYLDPGIVKFVVASPVACVLYIVTGAALWSFQAAHAACFRVLGISCVVAVFAIAGLSLAAHMLNLDAQISEAVLALIGAPSEAVSNFPAIVTARISLILINISLLLIQKPRPLPNYIAQIVVPIVGTVALVSFIGHLYSFAPFYSVAGSRWVIALPSAVALVCAAAATLLLRPERGLVSLFVGSGVAGIAARRYLLFTVALPLVVGAVLSYAERIERITPEESTLLFAITVILLSFIMVYINGCALRRAEQSVQENRDDLNRAQALARTGSWRLDVQSNQLRWSDETYRIFGVSRETPLTYDRFLSIIHRDDRAFVTAKWTAALKGEPYDIEHRIVVDGAVKWVREKAELEFDRDGTLCGGFGAVQDITDRKVTELALRRSEATLEAIMEYIPEGILVADAADSRVRVVSRYLAEIAGMDRNGMAGMTLADYARRLNIRRLDGQTVPVEDLPVWRSMHLAQNIINEEYMVARRDGGNVVVIINSAPIKDEQNRVATVVVSWRDITGIRKAEEARRVSEEQLNSFFSESPVLLMMLDSELRIVKANWKQDEYLGIPAADYLGRKFDEVEPEMMPVVGASFKKVIATGEPDVNIQVRGTTPGKPEETLYWLSSHFPIAMPGGRRGVGIVAMDVTERVRVEENLRRRESEIRAITSNSPDVIARFDRSLRHTFINPYGEKVYGKTRDEILGKTNRELGMPADKDAFLNRFFAEVIASGERRSVEFEYDSPNLGQVYFLSELVPEFDDRGQVRSILAITRDISQIKKVQQRLSDAVREAKRRADEAEEGRRILDALMDNIPEGILVTDGEGRVRSISRYLAGISGRAQEEIVGSSYLKVDELLDEPPSLHERRKRVRDGATAVVEAPAAEYPLGRALRKGEITISDERQVYLPDRSVHTAVLNAAPVRGAGGRIIGAVSSWRDITDRKKAEEAMRASNRELEQFAYVASHDLQEPLRMVASFTELLGRRYRDRFDERGRKYLQYIVDGASRMQALIEDLLAFSRVGRLDTERRLIDLNGVVDNVIADLAARIRETGAAVSRGQLPSIYANASIMGRLFMNLIGNALKFTAPGRAPRVRVAARHDGGEWRISVSDNGIGIESRYFEKIFVIFQRLHSREAYPGTGMGLAISKKIVENYGGRIWVESRPGEGSTFYFTVPDA